VSFHCLTHWTQILALSALAAFSNSLAILARAGNTKKQKAELTQNFE
jgi:hypothetical protein